MRPALAVMALLVGAAVLSGCAGCPDCRRGGAGTEVVGYCYRTLADVDCYTRPETGRQPLAVLARPVD